MEGFKGGQFRIESPNGATFQGIHSRVLIPDPKKRTFEISFEWIAGVRYILGEGWKPREYWGILDLPPTSLTVKFSYYYFQRARRGVKGKSDREERIKIKTPDGEICRFYKATDPLILTQIDGRFYPLPPPVD